MTFRNRLQYFLVKSLNISNKEALKLILEQKIKMNGIGVNANIEIGLADTIEYEGKCLQQGKNLQHYAFYKPIGIETTLNTSIADNLKEILPFDDELFPVGRLDKASEGLLLLTNDGRLFDKILRKEYEVEKEYWVWVNKPITTEFVEKMSSGIQIMGKTTLPCSVERLDETCFKIILIQGLNRQIRRMCYKLDYEVTRLLRVRIGEVLLGGLKPTEYKKIEEKDLIK